MTVYYQNPKTPNFHSGGSKVYQYHQWTPDHIIQFNMQDEKVYKKVALIFFKIIIKLPPYLALSSFSFSSFY